MNAAFFETHEAITYQGPESVNRLAYQWYKADELILNKTMAEHLRFAVCYWHSFCWTGTDPFGSDTFDRPWNRLSDRMEAARMKADVAFEFYRILGVPFFTFHDRDIAPEDDTLAQSNRNVREIADLFATKMEASGMRLLWGTANLFSHRRYMAGAATNPDPEVFAYAAAQVKNCLEVTHDLRGENYVLWGGREGYDTLLNTDLKREFDQLGRFMSMVVEHKHKIGFDGDILIEPKPREPTKHQYDFSVASIYAFLKSYGLENEIRVNIEQNHAILAGHSFEHEICAAFALGIFGSIDMNRGDYQSGWDTDQFPSNLSEVALALYYILTGGGFGSGGLNFDAKLRRQSIDADDLIHAHAGAIDICARGLRVAARMIEDGALADYVQQRYAAWNSDEYKQILLGESSLADLAQRVEQNGLDPQPISGQQEYLENIVNRYL
jgi:xylose isomerase